MDLFIGRNYLVTVHRGRVPALEEAYQRWTRGGQLLSEGVGFLTYTVMDALIDAFFPLIDAIEDYMDEIELEMFADLGRKGSQELLKLKRTLVTLRRVLSPLREVFNAFLRRGPMFSPNTRIYFQDVQDHVLRILDVLEIEREMVASALEAYLTVLSNRLNTTMQTLTVITMVVAVVGGGVWSVGDEFRANALHKFGLGLLDDLRRHDVVRHPGVGTGPHRETGYNSNSKCNGWLGRSSPFTIGI